MGEKVSRRMLLAGGGAMLRRTLPLRAADEDLAQHKLKVAIFSKHLQFLAGEELAKAAAGIGFDGIDITVRKGGHVDPGRVSHDLPRWLALSSNTGSRCR